MRGCVATTKRKRNGKPRPGVVVDDWPAPFGATRHSKRVTVAGRTVTLRLYVNRDGCEVWATVRPKRGDGSKNHGDAFNRATF